MDNIKIVDIKGKEYVNVAERVRLVHMDKDKPFEIIESSYIIIAERILWKAVIKVGGIQYIGHAEVHLNAPKHLPEGANPFECAETSAIGRALGMAGYGSVDSIASLDEIYASMGRQLVDPKANTIPQQQSPQRQAPVAPAPTPKKEINPEHEALLAAFKGMVSKEELQAFITSTGVKEKKWGGDEFKQAADLLASYPIPVSLQSAIRQMMDVYGERVTRECCSTLFPEVAGKLFSEMPVTTALKFLKVGQKDARFYHELVLIYDPEQKTVKVKLQIDSILQLFYQPELQEKRKWLYSYLVKSVRQSPQILDKLSDEFREIFVVELADIKKLAQTVVIPKKEAA